MTRVAVLTPPAAGAIATVEVSGPQAWEIARSLFRPAGKPLSETPEIHRFWFGTFGGDEVILAVTSADAIEIHCHGGRRVVRWVVEQFVERGCSETPPPAPPPVGEGSKKEAPLSPWGRGVGGWGLRADLLQRATTLRTAAILLDQLHGAFDQAVERILGLIDADPRAATDALAKLVRFAPVGRHLVEPWKVVVAGAPNVGKSSLVNALAGFQRAVVSEIAGTTRDAVSVQVAFDGWPVELTDTAGLRDAEGLEAEGIERANRALAGADLILWLVDLTDPQPVLLDLDQGSLPCNGDVILIANKSDLPPAWNASEVTFSYNYRARAGSGLQLGNWDRTVTPLAVSATTGAGITELVQQIVALLVPEAPLPGTAVPFTPALAHAVELAYFESLRDRFDDAARVLREAVARPG